MSSSTARRAVPPRTRSTVADAAAAGPGPNSTRQTTTSSTAPTSKATRTTTSNTANDDPPVKATSNTAASSTTINSRSGFRTVGTRKRPALGDLTNAKRRERERLAALEREAKAGKVQAGSSKGAVTKGAISTRGVAATGAGGAIRRPGAEVNGAARRGTTSVTSANSRIGSNPISSNRRALTSTNTNTNSRVSGRGVANDRVKQEEKLYEEDDEEDGDGNQHEVDNRETKRIKTGGNYADEALEDQEVEVEEKDQGWIDLDAEDIDDPLMVAEYVNDIFDYMKALELTTMPSGDYIDKHPDVTWDLRGVLVDWLIDTHSKFRLLPETLFLTLNIVDRFLTQRTISLVKLQLVGITAMFIAAKYEEVICPSVQNFLYVADGGYNEEEILRAERYVLKVINFNLSYPNPMNFLRRISKADNYDIQTRTVAKYFMEISVVDYRLIEHPPSLVAAGAVWMAREVLERGKWTPTLVHYSSYSEAELLATAEIMLDYVLRPTSHLNFHKKYAGKKFMRASNYVVEWARGAFPEAADLAKEEEQDLNTLLVDLYERQGLVRPGLDGISRGSTVERESALLESGDFGSENDNQSEEEDDHEDEEDEEDEDEDERYDDEDEQEEEVVKPSKTGSRR